MALYQLQSATYSLDKLTAVYTDSDCLLLIGDGVYQLHSTAAFKSVYVRQKDLEQRGINTALEHIILVSDEEWVNLTLTHQPVRSEERRVGKECRSWGEQCK